MAHKHTVSLQYIYFDANLQLYTYKFFTILHVTERNRWFSGLRRSVVRIVPGVFPREEDCRPLRSFHFPPNFLIAVSFDVAIT